jgi:hypothetical protein
MRFLFFLILILVVFSCTKDKVPKEEPIPIDQRISGKYNVYDSSGNYLYDMELKYVVNYSVGPDSIIFMNFDNDFSYSRYQSSVYDEYAEFKYISFLSPFPTKDKNNKSWSLSNTSDGIYDNTWRNDTIRMRFRKHNTPWWPSESVPYLDTIIKQIAVKQH